MEPKREASRRLVVTFAVWRLARSVFHQVRIHRVVQQAYSVLYHQSHIHLFANLQPNNSRVTSVIGHTAGMADKKWRSRVECQSIPMYEDTSFSSLVIGAFIVTAHLTKAGLSKVRPSGVSKKF
jgi:hypothetical protein